MYVTSLTVWLPAQLGSSLELTSPCLASLCRLMTCRGKISLCKTALELCFHTVQPELSKISLRKIALELCFHTVQPELNIVSTYKTVLELCFHTVQPELVESIRSTKSLRTDFRKYFQVHFRWREGRGFL